jgi:hypothetical protein
MAAMLDRRSKRSNARVEALQFLIEAVADRSGVRALVLVDDFGRIVAGMGVPRDVAGLAVTARAVAWRRASEVDLDQLARGSDVTARPVATREGMLYFAAMGDRVAGVGDAVKAVHRILAETLPS